MKVIKGVTVTQSSAQLFKEIIPKENDEVSHLRIVDDKFKNTKYFYKISNPDKLALIGSGFVEDFKGGTRGFAIASTGYKASQQRTILALASYFDIALDVKILIISDVLDRGQFKELIDVGSIHKIPTGDNGDFLKVCKFYHHFSFIDLNCILENDIVEIIDVLYGEYDVVFWDMPVLAPDKSKSDTFNKIAPHFDSLSLVVSPTDYRKNDTVEIRKHFDGYGINVSGIKFKNVGGIVG